MKCSVEGCGRDAPYKAAKLCQKHYFRVRRNGSVETLPTSRKKTIMSPNGYVRAYEPAHPLADQRGYVFEHRKVMWGAVGEVCGACEICSKPESWLTCHVDHIDEDRQNNARVNLRILCRGCNVKRGFTAEGQAARGQTGLIEFEGKRDTAAGWARYPRVSVTGATIRRRKAAGMPDYDALFAPKATHSGSRRT